MSNDLLFDKADWDFPLLNRIYDACEDVAVGEMGLSVYPNQIEIITSEQMLDAYSSNGMPLFYKHWSFGKHFAVHEASYRRGLRGLAYEIVINSSPCIPYLMEENTATMQTLVIAHAAFGHNHFFKNNGVFKQWTDAESILDYLQFAQRYITSCEEKHGASRVERLLDSAHALMGQSVHRTKPPKILTFKGEEKRLKDRALEAERSYNDLWGRTVPAKMAAPKPEANPLAKVLPEENLLYFFEKYAPKLEPWEREVVRIVRKIAQYFYPQMQTKVMNEGCATFVHYEVLNRLHEKGRLSNGSMLEFIDSHSGVIMQPGFDSQYHSGFNPYALGSAIMHDIKRIVTDPTEEDRRWFPQIAGGKSGNYLDVFKDACEGYRDESFILQFLSPQVMRDFRLFKIRADDGNEDYVTVDAIHDEQGYHSVRQALAAQYEPGVGIPDIQVTNVDLAGNRMLTLEYIGRNNRYLNEESVEKMLPHLGNLWRYDVLLLEKAEDGEVLQEYLHEASGED